MAILIGVYALLAFGFLLCFVGKFPGQVLAYAGMLLAYFGMNAPYPAWLVVACGVLVVASLVVNKTVAPKLASKVHEFGKAGKWGTVVGSIFALLVIAAITANAYVSLVLLMVLPYVFAFVFEFISKKDFAEGAKRAAGAYTLFAASTLLNVVICAFCFVEVAYGWIN